VDRALTQEQRTAVWLRYVEDMAMQDIAEVMGKSQVGVRVMLHRARHTLARHMQGDEAAESVGIEVRVIRQEAHAGEPS
jgi:DNA-directed RNA polymerase specialized sigma24 family protein